METFKNVVCAPSVSFMVMSLSSLQRRLSQSTLHISRQWRIKHANDASVGCRHVNSYCGELHSPQKVRLRLLQLAIFWRA